MYSEEKAKGVVGKHFAEWIRCGIPGFSQPSHRGSEREVSRKGLWRALSSTGADPHDMHKRPARSTEMLSQQKCYSRTEGEREAEASRAISGPEDGALSNRGLFRP